MLFKLLSKLLDIRVLIDFADYIPSNVLSGKKVLGTNVDNFDKFVCCPSCSALYNMEDCLDTQLNGNTVSKLCPFIRFPLHPQKQYRKACATTLLKTVRTSAGTTTLYPRMTYCYRSIIDSLQQLILRDNFFSDCEKWRNRSVQDSILEDIYDGQIWKDFKEYDGKPFFSVPFNFGLTLNIDWFQPFKRTNYSVGAIYVAIQNLPREQRFLSENTILVGIIPCEPSKVINTILEPLVNDLLKLWDGVIMESSTSNKVIVRAALICVSCDIPAARKVCGFVGHRARKGCNKCLRLSYK